MIQKDYTTRVLEAEEGHQLTQSDESVDLMKRMVSKIIYLAATDSPDNWKEITDEDAQAILDAQKAEREKAEAEREAHLNEEHPE